MTAVLFICTYIAVKSTPCNKCVPLNTMGCDAIYRFGKWLFPLCKFVWIIRV